MTDQKISLALAFLQKQPDAAAGILEQHDIEEVVSFISDTPNSHIAPVIHLMLPQYTARICKILPPEIAATFLSELNNGEITTILRYLDKKQSSNILRYFPTRTRAACNFLLKYSKDTVGAWMSPDITTILHSHTVAEALHLIKTDSNIIHADYTFIVNRKLTLIGRVHFTDLLQADGDQPVLELINKKIRALTGRVNMHKASEHGDWSKYDVMPVLNRDKQFVGALRHVDLRKGLEHLAAKEGEQQEIAPDKKEENIINLGQMYISTLLTLFSMMTNIIKTDLRS